MSEIALIGTGPEASCIADALLLRAASDRLVIVDPAVSTESIPAWVATRLVAANQYERTELEYRRDLESALSAAVVIVAIGDAVCESESARSQVSRDRVRLAVAKGSIVRQIVRTLAPSLNDQVLIVADRPVEVLTTMACVEAMKHLEEGGSADRPAKHRIIGAGTVGSTTQFRRLVAERMRVHTDDVAAMVIGERGQIEIPLWSTAAVAQTPLHAYCPKGKRPINVRERVEIFETVRTLAIELDEVGGTTHMADALAVAEIVAAVLQDERRILTVSAWQGQYDPDADELSDDASDRVDDPCCLARPCIVDREGIVRVIEELPLNANEHAALAEAARSVRRTYAAALDSE